MTLKVGVEKPLQIAHRFARHSRSHAIGDIYDVFPELLTNADDSYARLFAQNKRDKDGGDILIEHQEQRKGHPSRVVIRDRAEGMDDRDMEAKLASVGGYASKGGNRGYMGRGAKDCTELGDLTFESIKDDRYYRCRITNNLKIRLEAKGDKATKDVRQRLGVPHGNGTSVTLELLPDVRLPRFDTLVAELPWHYALRDIMAEQSASRVLLRRVGDERPVRLVHRNPDGQPVLDETYPIEGYPQATARLRLWRAAEPLDGARPRFERNGILIKGKRAIHECTLFSDEFRADPNARRYFGRLDCHTWTIC
jgi:hypothetical protein